MSLKVIEDVSTPLALSFSIGRYKNGKEKSRAIIMKEIRQLTKRVEKESCAVCGEHKQISHLHHIIPVSVLADYILHYDLFDVDIPNPVVSLCPNHHAYYHGIESERVALDSIPLHELKRMRELASQYESKVFEEIWIESTYEVAEGWL